MKAFSFFLTQIVVVFVFTAFGLLWSALSFNSIDIRCSKNNSSINCYVKKSFAFGIYSRDEVFKEITRIYHEQGMTTVESQGRHRTFISSNFNKKEQKTFRKSMRSFIKSNQVKLTKNLKNYNWGFGAMGLGILAIGVLSIPFIPIYIIRYFITGKLPSAASKSKKKNTNSKTDKKSVVIAVSLCLFFIFPLLAGLAFSPAKFELICYSSNKQCVYTTNSMLGFKKTRVFMTSYLSAVEAKKISPTGRSGTGLADRYRVYIFTDKGDLLIFSSVHKRESKRIVNLIRNFEKSGKRELLVTYESFKF